MNSQEMLDVLKSKVEEGVIESSDLPRLPTIQGWITDIQHSYMRKILRDGN